MGSAKRDAILCQRIRAPRPPPKIVLKAWQVQRDEESQRRTGIEKSIAEQENQFKIDFRVQGVPHIAVLVDQGRTSRIQELAHTPNTHSRTEALITDLQKTDVFNPFSQESKRTIHNLGKSCYSNWVKSPRRLNAYPVLNIYPQAVTNVKNMRQKPEPPNSTKTFKRQSRIEATRMERLDKFTFLVIILRLRQIGNGRKRGVLHNNGRSINVIFFKKLQDFRSQAMSIPL